MDIKNLFEDQTKELEELFTILVKNIENLNITSRDEHSKKEYIKIQPNILGEIVDNTILEQYNNWQIKTASYLERYSTKTIYEHFSDLTGLTKKNSLFNMILLKNPWIFTDWGYSKKIQDDTTILFRRTGDDYFELERFSQISEQNELISIQIKEGYLKRLSEYKLGITTVLQSPNIIVEAEKTIRAIENRKICRYSKHSVSLTKKTTEMYSSCRFRNFKNYK